MSSESVHHGAISSPRSCPTPTNPPNTVMLSGYVGASSEDGHTRLYFDMELSSYVDIPNDAILHREPLEARQHHLMDGSSATR